MRGFHILYKTYPKFNIPNIVNTQRLFLNTTQKIPSGNLKIESEHKKVLYDLVPNIVLHTKIDTLGDWKHVREAILNSESQITSKTVDAAILTVCLGSKSYKLGLDYVEFLKHQKMPLGLATLGKYFKLIYFNNSPNCLSESDQREIYNLYQELRNMFKVLDAGTCEGLIHVLSLTKHWGECLKLLEEVKKTCFPAIAAYNVLIAACFRNNDTELGWKFLEECAESDRFPSTVAYSSYLDLCEKTQNLANLEKLFEYFRKFDIKCDTETANKFVDLYKKFNLKAEIVIFRNSVKCRNCHKHLQKLELKDAEFEELKKAIFKNTIIGSNVFCRTTPKEVDEFKRFIANMKNYDVIIDGLNVAYSIGTKQPSHVFAFLVKSVVEHFVVQKKKVLVLGRTHMQKWPKRDWSYVTINADIFLTQTLSHDDPYLLYCALHSAKNTIIVSRDLMRNHVFKLNDPRLKILFSRWLSQCQYQLLYVNDVGKVFFKYPLPYAKTAQRIDNIWHIPCNEPSINNDFVHKWLCLNK